MSSNSARVLVVLLLAFVQVNLAAAQTAPDPWYGGQQRPRDMAPVLFQDTFTIELPSKWQLAPGHAHTLFTTVEKKTPPATITLQHTRMNEPLKADPDVMTEVKNLYLGQVQGSEPGGNGFTAEVKQGKSGYFIRIQYRRPGLEGVQNHVTHYFIPVGNTMYRLICIAPVAEVGKKYQAVFAWVAASFTPLTTAAK